jgi:hypothetical protein
MTGVPEKSPHIELHGRSAVHVPLEGGADPSFAPADPSPVTLPPSPVTLPPSPVVLLPSPVTPPPSSVTPPPSPPVVLQVLPWQMHVAPGSHIALVADPGPQAAKDKTTGAAAAEPANQANQRDTTHATRPAFRPCACGPPLLHRAIEVLPVNQASFEADVRLTPRFSPRETGAYHGAHGPAHARPLT